MKSLLKVLAVSVVIFGLIASYIFTGKLGGSVPTQKASVFNGPTGEPSANGPTGQPPVNQ